MEVELLTVIRSIVRRFDWRVGRDAFIGLGIARLTVGGIYIVYGQALRRFNHAWDGPSDLWMVFTGLLVGFGGGIAASLKRSSTPGNAYRAEYLQAFCRFIISGIVIYLPYALTNAVSEWLVFIENGLPMGWGAILLAPVFGFVAMIVWVIPLSAWIAMPWTWIVRTLDMRVRVKER